MHTNTNTIEILEARIAPAIFFVSGAVGDLKIYNSALGDMSLVGDGPTALPVALADATVRLGAGDSLRHDADGNPATAGDQTVLMTVSAGLARVFFKDINGDTDFDLDEMSGVAFGHGLNARIFTDVSGDIIPALSSTGAWSSPGNVVQFHNATITNLTIDGGAGYYIAAGSIQQLTVGQKIHGVSPGTGFSVDVIVTGTAMTGEVFTLDGNAAHAITFALPVVAAGTSGGGMANVTLAGGAGAIEAGDGAAKPGGAGGAGGSITNLVVASMPVLQQDTRIAAGHGGSGATGGAGGSITVRSAVLATSVGSSSGEIALVAGDGGAGTTTGGAGGSISAVTGVAGPHVSIAGNWGRVHILAGAGGASAGSGAGGVGGNVLNLKVTDTDPAQQTTPVVGFDAPVLDFVAGAGGANTGSGNGGAGGKVSGNSAILPSSGGAIATLDWVGGAGGDATGTSGNGGAGGAVLGNTASIQSAFQTTGVGVGIFGGRGGDGRLRGGAGGSIGSNVVTTSDLSGGVFDARAGDGGDILPLGSVTAIASGNGGDISPSNQFTIGDAQTVTVVAGGAGLTDASKAAGGRGGVVNGLKLVTGDIAGLLDVTAFSGAFGGTAAGSYGAGGAGGSVTTTTITVNGSVLGDVVLHVGDGGAGNGTGAGGAGGAMTNVTLTVSNDVGDGTANTGLRIEGFAGGIGGSGGSIGGNGGAGGAVTGLSVNVGSVLSSLTLRSGNGGDGGTGTAGLVGGLSAVGGAITNATINFGTMPGSATIDSGYGGSMGRTNGGTASMGGTINKLTFIATGAIAGDANVSAGLGGVGSEKSSGGKGGSIANTTLKAGGFMNGLGVFGGDGGAALGTAGHGGHAGGISTLTIIATDLASSVPYADLFGTPYFAALAVVAGSGGSGSSSGSGNGGMGAAV
ncbi:MAG: hypothetical protein ABMA13_15810, partial [Chthoniobacteraceae bacterium]